MVDVCDFILLARPQQWYKNLLLFIALVFVGWLFNPIAFFTTLLGFFAFCLISSANYVTNDILDFKTDRLHPEKKSRPLASGKVTVLQAAFFATGLLGGGLVLAFVLDTFFGLAASFLFFWTFVYSLWLKKEVIADVLAISFNFVVRAVAGALARNGS